MSAAPMVFSSEQIAALRAPCLYIAFRGDEALYVGMSSAGLCRPIGPQHEHIGTADDITLLVIPVPRRDLLDVETVFIAALKPKLNRPGRHIATLGGLLWWRHRVSLDGGRA